MRLAIAAIIVAVRELASKRGRTLYLIVTLTIAVASWLGLASFAAPFISTAEIRGSGVTITNARRGGTLPRYYADRIMDIPGVQEVAWTGLQIVTCKQFPLTTATINAYGGQGTTSYLRNLRVSQKLEAQWNADPLGVLVGSKLAADCGWRPGSSVAPPDAMGRPLELHITGIFHDGSDSGGQVAIAHFRYINETAPLLGKDKVLYISIRTPKPDEDDALAAKIDTYFAHSDPPVQADTRSTVQNAWARFGRVQDLLAFVALAILSCTALVLISVLAHTAQERRARMAVMHAIGFPRGFFMASFLLEVLGVAVAGVTLGTALAFGIMHTSAPAASLWGDQFAPAWAYVGLLLWVSLLVSASLAWPCALIASMRPAEYQHV